MRELPKHPSGRPVRSERRVGRGYWNVPGKGMVLPRLQDNHGKLDAIGFHVGREKVEWGDAE